MPGNVARGSLFVALGACCYGMLGSFVKMAYSKGFSTAEVVLAQFGIGFVMLLLLSVVERRFSSSQKRQPLKAGTTWKLILAGSSMGFTSICYYMAVKTIPVGVAIVLLIQTVWMSLVLEWIISRKRPGAGSMVAALLVLAGTVLATSVFSQSLVMNWSGFGWGILSAVGYTATMYSSRHVATGVPPLKRSLYMVLGGLIIIVVVFHSAINTGFSFKIFSGWGILIALFGTVLPPLLFTRGMPLTGIGLGAILAALEIPVSVLMANRLLKETVTWSQAIGIVLILSAILLMNIKAMRKPAGCLAHPLKKPV